MILQEKQPTFCQLFGLWILRIFSKIRDMNSPKKIFLKRFLTLKIHLINLFQKQLFP